MHFCVTHAILLALLVAAHTYTAAVKPNTAAAGPCHRTAVLLLLLLKILSAGSTGAALLGLEPTWLRRPS
jgi:hypothetical protein